MKRMRSLVEVDLGSACSETIYAVARIATVESSERMVVTLMIEGVSLSMVIAACAGHYTSLAAFRGRGRGIEV